MLVEPADRLDLAPDERVEVEVEDARGRQRCGVARAHRRLEAGRQPRRPLGADRARVDRVARHAAQQRREGDQRRDDAQRVAVRLHDARVRVLGEQRVQRPQVAGRLQHPAPGRCAPLEVLEPAPVRRVERAMVDRLEPALVVADAVRRREQDRRELVRRDRDALLRQRRAHPVHRLEAGDQLLDAGEVLLDRRDARIGVEARALGWRPRAHHLPGRRHAIGGIAREQLVQDRRAGARQAEDEERRADGATLDLRVAAQHVLHAQAVLEQAQQIRARDDAAERRQRRLALEGVDEARERGAERRIAEILQPRAVLRRGEQPLGVEARHAQADRQRARRPRD